MFDFDDDYFVHSHPQALEDEDIMVEDLPLPALAEDNSDRESLIQQQEEDTTLANCRRYADTGKRVYYWDKGLLVHQADDILGQPVIQVILPQLR